MSLDGSLPALRRMLDRSLRPPAVVLDVSFVNGLAACRSLHHAGAGVIAVDHRRSALGFRTRTAVGVLSPDPADEPAYVDFLAELGETFPEPAVVFPTHDAPLEAVAAHAERLAAYTLPGSGWDVLGPLQHKRVQYEAAARAGVGTPRTFYPAHRAEAERFAAELRYPAIVKPSDPIPFKRRFGRPVLVCQDAAELLEGFDAATGSEPMLQEVVPGGDDSLWTVGTYTDAEGHALGIFCGRKLLQMPRNFGTCRVGEARWRDDAVEQALALLAELRYHGIAQTEFREDARDGTLRLMEVNPRLWQWHGLARACGVDLPRIAYEDTLGRPPAPVVSGRAHDGRRWVAGVAHLRASRAEGQSLRETLAPFGRRDVVEATFDLHDPVPALISARGLVTAPLIRGSTARHATIPPVTTRARSRWLDYLLLATLTVTTWAKIHWQFAGQVALEDILALLFLFVFVADRVIRGDRSLPRSATALLLILLALEVVFLLGFFNIETRDALSQYGKGMTKYFVHFAFLIGAVAHVVRRGKRFHLITVGALCGGIVLNGVYGVLQLLAKVGGGINLDKVVIGKLTQGQGGVGGINVFGQATGVQNGNFTTEGVFRVNALALDPNHLGIMLVVPIMILLPFSLRRGVRDRIGIGLALAVAFCFGVEILTLSRSGFLGVAVGLLVLAIPLWRKILSWKIIVPVVVGLAILGAAYQQSHYVHTVIKSRATLSDKSAQAHYAIFSLVPPVLDEHPLLGLGLNTFSVYYEFQTGRTDWGPHSFYVALIAETGLIGTTAFGLFLLWLLIRLVVLKRAARLFERRGDPDEARAGPLADGLLAAMLGTMAANVFYLTMQFYYFYALVLVVVAAAELYAPARVPKAVAVTAPVRAGGIQPA